MDFEEGTSSPPCLEKETGPGIANSPEKERNTTDGQHFPPPLTFEGILSTTTGKRKSVSGDSPKKKLGIFARVYPVKRGKIGESPRTNSYSPDWSLDSSTARIVSPENIDEKHGPFCMANGGKLRDSPTRQRGRLPILNNHGLLVEERSPDDSVAPLQRSIGKAPPVGIFGINRASPTRRTIGSPKSRGKPGMGSYDVQASTKPSLTDTFQEGGFAPTVQGAIGTSRFSFGVPSTGNDSSIAKARGRPQIVTYGSSVGVDTASKDSSEISHGKPTADQRLSPEARGSPKRGRPRGRSIRSRGRPRKVDSMGQVRTGTSLTNYPLQSSKGSPKIGRGHGSRSRRVRGGRRGRSRGVTTRLRDPNRELLVTGKRNSPLRYNTETSGSKSPYARFGSTDFHGGVSCAFTGRGGLRGSRGTRGRGRGRGRVRTRGGAIRISEAKKSLAPFLGLPNYDKLGEGDYKGLSPTALNAVKQDKDVFFNNALPRRTGLDKNGNVTSDFPSGGIKILSIQDVTTGHSNRPVTPIDAIKCIRPQPSRVASVAKTSSSPQKFQEGEDVLARWTDGLVYLGTIQKVEEEKEKCFVAFEDNSEHWVLFKDLQKGPTEMETDDITCVVCNEGESDPPNEIVICDKCGTGFHQLCHQPFIESRFVTSEEVPWICRKCIFATAAKVGGASNKGHAAKIFQQVKRSLPYKIEDLTWDKSHRTNTQKCYCYCGGPGAWYLKMLQCCRCMQWFHEACTQCLPTSMLYGDRFYLFVCSVCNCGPEYIKRLQMKWLDLVHLVLYNLTLNFGKKYFTLEDDILPFLNEKWSRLGVDHLAERRSEKTSFLLDALHSSTSRFACGKEVRKKKDLWGLRSRTPPVPPSVVLPAVGQVNDEVMNNFESVEGSKVVTYVPAGSLTPVPQHKLMKPPGKRKRLAKDEEQKRTKKAKRQLLAATSSKNPGRPPSANQSYQGYAGTTPAPPKVQRVCKTSILDTIEPLEKVLQKQRYPTVTTIHHPRCFVPSSSNYLPRSTETSPAKRKPGRPKLSESSVAKKKKGRPPKRSLAEDDPAPRRTSPRTGSGRNADDPGEGSVDDNSQEGASSRRALLNSMTTYFGAEGRIASGEKYKVLAKRRSSSGQCEYLIQWEGTTP